MPPGLFFPGWSRSNRMFLKAGIYLQQQHQCFLAFQINQLLGQRRFKIGEQGLKIILQQQTAVQF